MDTNENPFLALFEPLPAPAKTEATRKASPEKSISLENSSLLQKVNEIIEDCFAITINPYGLLGRNAKDPVKQTGLVLLESFALDMQHSQNGRSWLNVDILGQALFERLLLTKEDLIKSLLSDQAPKEESHATVTRIIFYLAECYNRCHRHQISLEKKVRQ